MSRETHGENRNVRVVAYRSATSADLHWLWDLKCATMRDYVAAIFEWNDEEQRKMFEAKFDPSKIRIIQFEGCDAGLLELVERESDFFLGRIEILPELQKKGIGSAVIGGIIGEADNKVKCVRLQVLRSNPARKLYQRLGFNVEETTATHIKMKRPPNRPMPRPS